jgi:hypothetical protein
VVLSHASNCRIYNSVAFGFNVPIPYQKVHVGGNVRVDNTLTNVNLGPSSNHHLYPLSILSPAESLDTRTGIAFVHIGNPNATATPGAAIRATRVGSNGPMHLHL